MPLKKAIERLETFVERHPGPGYSELIPAIQLGIEALKREQAKRTQLSGLTIAPLPGETED